MWLGEKITERGIGNGISLIIFINIIGRVPNDDAARPFETLPRPARSTLLAAPGHRCALMVARDRGRDRS